MRRFQYEPSHGDRERGRAHGETFADEIAELAAIRMNLCAAQPWFGDAAAVLALAERHLPVLARHAPRCSEELLGIAEGAGVTPAHIVVLNHYTDLRDIGQAGHAAPRNDIGGCSTIWTETGPLLGQTWDMHASAEPFVMMLGVPRDDRPAAWLFTIVGCLGMAGLNEAGVGVCVNNLRSLDARIGLVWPAVVREALVCESAPAAREVLLAAEFGSGHHYVVADDRDVFGVETSGERVELTFDGGAPRYVHTNHCLNAGVAARSTVAEGSTTFERYERVTTMLDAQPVSNVKDLWRVLGSHEGHPRSICAHLGGPDRPNGVATCGALVMDLAARRASAAPGCVHECTPEAFAF